MNKNEFGNFLAKLRNENKLTQEQLGEKLNVGSKTISKWECGISSPDLNTLCELAKIYNLSLYELINCERIKNPLLSKYDIKKILNKKSIKNILMKKAVLVIICFFLLTAVLFCINYTIKNYGRIEVYELVSDSKNYYVEGHLTRTQDDYYLSISKVETLDNSTLDDNEKYKELTFGILEDKDDDNLKNAQNSNNQVVEYFDRGITFENVIDKVVLHIDSKIENIHSSNLILYIKCVDEHNNEKKIEINMHLKRRYTNSQI
mgnify:FL=1